MEPNTDPMSAAEAKVYDHLCRSGPSDMSVVTDGAVSALTITEKVSLPIPRASRSASPLLARRSSKEVWHALHRQQLSEFVHAAYGDCKTGRRPYPTSGGLDQISLLVLANNVRGLTAGGYLVAAHELTLLRIPQVDDLREPFSVKVSQFLGLGWDTPASAIFVLMCDWSAIAGKYANCTLLTGFWDSGAVLQTMYIAAAELGLPGTACAAVAPQAFGRALGVSHYAFGHVATYVLGGAPGKATV